MFDIKHIVKLKNYKMNLKLLPFVIAAFISTAANAENFDEVTTEYLRTNDAFIYGNMELYNKNLGLTINLPRAAENYSYFIECKNNNIQVNNRLFLVNHKGNVISTGLSIKDQSADHCCSPSLSINYQTEEKAFEFTTNSNMEDFHPVNFRASQFNFENGDMVVNGNITCKKETVLDSVLSVNDNAAFHKNINVSGEASLSTLNINIPYTTDKSGTKTRSYDYLIDCSDATTNSYKRMFTVDWNGNVKAKGLTLREGTAIDTPYSSTLNMYFDKESNSFVFNTAGNEGSSDEKRNSLTFDADNYMFNKGDMFVNGKITCKNEINVTSLNANDVNVKMNNVADYVFDENYDLKSLSEVESYVKENKHLPGIPSAEEIEQNGVSLSKMSNMLLEKVEELTLHLIRLEKENAELKAKFESLEK